MKHIKSTGCGFALEGAHSIIDVDDKKWYYGAVYNCQGTTELNPAFQHTTLTAGGNLYDNYYNLPQKVKGFIMTLSPVIPMDTVANPKSLVVPETSCVNDFDLTDPNSTDYYMLYGDPRLYVSINGSTYGGTEAMWNQEYTTEDAVYELNPGALEPMIDTAFPPVGVDNITFDDVQYTGGFILDRLNNSWRNMIQNQINSLYNRSSTAYMDWSGINGLARLMATDQEESECPNFQIRLASGTPLVEGHRNIVWPTYNVTGGVIYVDGDSVSVASATGYGGQEFDVYLDIWPKGVDNAVATTATLFEVIPKDSWDVTTITRQEGHVYLFVGCVTAVHEPAVSTGPFSPSREYTLFKITQGDCITDVSLSGGTGGTTVTEIYDYEGPYKIVYAGLDVNPAEPPEEYEYVPAGFGVIGTPTDIETVDNTNVQRAGRIYQCGDEATQGWGPEADGIDGGDIFAYLQGGTLLGYGHTVPETADTTEDAEPIYTIRLGNASFKPSPVDIPVGGTTVTIQASALSIGLKVVPPSEVAVETPGTTITNLTRITGSTSFSYLVDMLIDGSTAWTTTATVLPKIKQYHTGDIYIDCQDIPEPPTPPPGYEYEGPFKVSRNFASTEEGSEEDPVYTFDVTGVGEPEDDSDTDTYYAGWIYLDGSTAYEPESVFAQEQTSNDSLFVYAHIGLKASEDPADGYTVVDCRFSDSYTPDPDAVTASGEDKTYIVRLAKLVDDTAEQLHYGDIYIDSQQIPDIPEPPAPDGYNGPFKVVGATNSATAYVSLYAFDGNTSTNPQKKKLGYAVINGNDADAFAVAGGTVSITAEYTDIYAHVILTKGTPTATTQPYEIDDYDVTTSATYESESLTSDNKVYSFRLARVHKTSTTVDSTTTYTTEVTQIQHGDLYLGNVNEPIQQSASFDYKGPFALNGISLSCPVCGQTVTNKTIIGHCIINGNESHDVYSTDVNITEGTKTAVDIYLNVVPGANGIGITVDDSITGNTNGYSIWLGHASRTKTNTGTAQDPVWNYGAWQSDQIHFGEAHVDGRWS